MLITTNLSRLPAPRTIAIAERGTLAARARTSINSSLARPFSGGDFNPKDRESVIADVARRWPFLSDNHARRLVSAYGTRVDRIIDAAKSMDDLGVRFGVDLTAAEVHYLMREEWAETPDDILWRRSKLALRLSREDQEALSRFMVSSLGATG